MQEVIQGPGRRGAVQPCPSQECPSLHPTLHHRQGQWSASSSCRCKGRGQRCLSKVAQAQTFNCLGGSNRVSPHFLVPVGTVGGEAEIE